MNRHKWIAIAILAVVVFGVLMGIRDQLPSLWMRVGVGVLAGGVYALVIFVANKIGIEKRNRQ